MHGGVVPALLLNRLSGYAMDRPVKYPDRGWESVRNIYTTNGNEMLTQLDC